MNIEKFILILMSFLIPFFTPICGSLAIVVAVVLVDFIFGIWKSAKNNIPITSHGFKVSITKMTLYTIFILLAHGIDIQFFESSNYAVKFFSGAVVFTEVKSIIENLEEITGLKIWDLIKDKISFTKVK